MLKQWICATTGKVVFTPKGRAYNIRAPTLGSTANAALLSVIYGQTRSSYIPQAKADRYTCFARSQVTLLLILAQLGTTLVLPMCPDAVLAFSGQPATDRGTHGRMHAAVAVQEQMH